MMAGRWHHLAMGGLISLAVVLGTALFSAWPAWQSMAEDHGLVRLSFTHSGARNCRDRTEEELAALPRNMRQAQVCDSRRLPVYVEMDLNGATVFARDLAPTGLSGTGPSRIYAKFELPAGPYDIDLRLRDDPTLEGYTNTATRQVQIGPGQSLAIDYNAEAGGFIFH